MTTEDRRKESPPEQAAPGKAAGSAAAEPEAGPREIAVGIVVVAVMLGGFAYCYFQGMETGAANAHLEDSLRFPAWAQALREGRLAGAMRLGEGQEFVVRITSADGASQEEKIPADGGDRVAVIVVPGGVEAAPAATREPGAADAATPPAATP